MKTDDEGKATFTVDAPSTDPDKNDHNVRDTLSFDGPGDAVPATVVWRDDDHGTANKLAIDVPDYALIYLDEGDSVVDGNATVTLYDMYGNTAGVGLRVVAQIDGEPSSPVENDGVRVNSRGQAKFSRKGIDSDNNPTIEVSVTNIFERNEFSTNLLGTGNDQIPNVATNPTIPVVASASDGTPAANVIVTKLLKDADEFIGNVTAEAVLLYSYDSDDTFINASGAIIDMDEFESDLAKRDFTDTTADVDVLVYDKDGSSIFRISSTS